MKKYTPYDWIVLQLYGVLGAALGLLVFMFVFDGWRFVMTGRSTAPGKSIAGLGLSLCVGWTLGLLCYRIEPGADEVCKSSGTAADAILLTKRLLSIGTCAVGCYFLWQLAK